MNILGNIKVPLTARSFYPESDLLRNAQAINQIATKIGGLITKSCGLVGLPSAIQATLIFVETGGNNGTDTGGGKYIGYSQISIDTAATTVWLEFKNNRMNADELNYLNYLIGDKKSTAIKNAKTDTDAVGIINATDLHRPEVNIFIGAMYLRQCIDKASTAGVINRLDKAIAYYNRGYYTKLPVTSNINELLDSTEMPTVTKNYILKMFGSTSPLLYAMKVFPN